MLYSKGVGSYKKRGSGAPLLVKGELYVLTPGDLRNSMRKKKNIYKVADVLKEKKTFQPIS